ncbi:unnamed protein product [Meganyctiphanes norvegica]|uniref:Transcription initiation factor IIE subunit beta n=1 Tax=Meganyctiphanes norvegica TaxID=48144 RepID=A0AAV2Q6K8_MEGNR
MNELMKSKEAFKRAAMAMPTVENKKKRPAEEMKPPPEKSKKAPKPAPKPADDINYKAMGGGSQFKFGMLARIVRHMKTRHQEGETHPLTIDEILDETNLLHVSAKIKNWLVQEALATNIKVQVVDEKYIFKPPLNVRDRKSLMKLLQKHDLKGLGGILLDDIQESLPHCDKVMKAIDKDILRILRATDKKQIIFYHDKGIQFPVEREFVQLWRNTSVDGLQDDNIEEYLNKQGIKSMKDTNVRGPIRKKIKARKSRATKIADNQHLAGILQNYDQS